MTGQLRTAQDASIGERGGAERYQRRLPALSSASLQILAALLFALTRHGLRRPFVLGTLETGRDACQFQRSAYCALSRSHASRQHLT